ncbi:hypothetical protein IFM89_030685 [Coptis chinensis]|uniref:Uncharacterized protein n=1 Tax=Coptis chinensis TaxID=261450 RepID=A0A835MB31_9MAGN|nr:hypothetical protein IFM89_030685 [Coptis chinensis]
MAAEVHARDSRGREKFLTKTCSLITPGLGQNGHPKFSQQVDGKLVMYTIARLTEGRNGAYWVSDTVNKGQRLVFNQSGYIYQAQTNGTIINLSSEIQDSTRDYYQRATFDFDGVIRQYTYPRTSPSKDGLSLGIHQHGRYQKTFVQLTLGSLAVDFAGLTVIAE